MKKEISSLSETEYRALDIESFSSLKYILGKDGPKDFLHAKEKPFRGSPSSLLGTCVHHYLQGNRHLVAFNALPHLKKNLEAIKEFEKSFMESTSGEGVIVPKSFEPKLEAIMKNYNENTKVQKILSGCDFEKAYLFHIDHMNLKGKVDGVREDYIVEIKTSSGASTAEEFKEEALSRDYDMQAAMYLHASGKDIHYFVVVNTVEPFKLDVYKSSDDFIKSGMKKVAEAVRRYKKYIFNEEEWVGDEEIQEI